MKLKKYRGDERMIMVMVGGKIVTNDSVKLNNFLACRMNDGYKIKIKDINSR